MWDKGQGQRILKEFQRIYWIYSDQDHLNLAKLRYRHLRQRKRKNHNRNRTIQTRTFHPKKTNNLKRQKDNHPLKATRRHLNNPQQPKRKQQTPQRIKPLPPIKEWSDRTKHLSQGKYHRFS